MELVDKIQAFLNTIFNTVGLAAQAPGFLLGSGLIVAAILLYRRVEGSDGSGIGFKILASLFAIAGVPILLLSLRVGVVDATLWSVVTFAFAGFWLAQSRGKLVTVVGVMILVLGISTIIGFSSTAPAGSVLAAGVKSMTDQFGATWAAIKSH